MCTWASDPVMPYSSQTLLDPMEIQRSDVCSKATQLVFLTFTEMYFSKYTKIAIALPRRRKFCFQETQGHRLAMKFHALELRFTEKRVTGQGGCLGDLMSFRHPWAFGHETPSKCTLICHSCMLNPQG